MMFNQNEPKKAIELYVGFDYIQHNPHVANGKAGFIEYFERTGNEYPHKKVEFKEIIAEENMVVLHCFQQWPGDQNYAGIDIFRFDDHTKIFEHKDVLQIIPSKSANDNTMFWLGGIS